jgi:signal transduction histidine kinase
MTSLRGGLERVRRRSTTASDYADAIDTAIEQSDVVLNRFTALLRIAEIEAGGRRASFNAISLDVVLRDVVELYEPLAEYRGLSMKVHAPEAVEVVGDIDLLFGAIENLLDNALKFTPRGGQVTLDVWSDNGLTTLQVTDTGPGIDVNERKAVLRPFYRSAGAQAHMTAGHGLGLSLVAAIARMHGADFEIGDNQPGCKMLLRFAGSGRFNEPVTH